MSIPSPLDPAATREALDYFAKAGFEDIDTAIMYQGGKSEGALGERDFAAALLFCFAVFVAMFPLQIDTVLAPENKGGGGTWGSQRCIQGDVCNGHMPHSR